MLTAYSLLLTLTLVDLSEYQIGNEQNNIREENEDNVYKHYRQNERHGFFGVLL